jgi:hypothetical protein
MNYNLGTTGYTGLFVINPDQLIHQFPPKHENVFGHHTTLQYNPETFDSVQPGKISLLKIIARVFDDQGDALLVETDRSEKEYPHITLSCAEGVRRAYSHEMIKKFAAENKIIYLEEPVEIEVIEGYFNGQEDVIS